MPQGHLLFGAPLRLRGRLGVFRRREGHLLAAHLGPSLRPRVVLHPSFFTRRFLIPRCVARGPFSRVVHSPFVIVYDVFLSVPYARDGFLSGADGRVSRLRSTSPLAIALCISSLLWMSSAGSQSTGAVGRVSRPRSSTCKLSLHSISAISLPSCMTFTCTFSRFLFLTFRWRGQVFALFRSPARFSQLSWKGQDGWLPSFGFLQGLVVLCLLDSSDLKLHLRRACLESSVFFALLNGEGWFTVGLVVPRCSRF